MYPVGSCRAIESGQANSARVPVPSACAAIDKDSESQIRNALYYTEDLSSQLHSEISTLEHRLETGLTPVPPAPACTNGPGADQNGRSHILERVGSTNAMLTAAITRLRELRMRVEL